MATTSPDGIVYPSGTDQFAPLPPHFAALAQSVQDRLNSAWFPREVTSSTARDALYPSPVAGDTVYRTDTQVIEQYFTTPSATTAGWYGVGGFLPKPVSNTVTASTTVTATAAGTVYPGSANVSLVLPQRALVQVTISGTIGSGLPWTDPVSVAHLGFNLSGALSRTQSTFEGVSGANTPVAYGGSYSAIFNVPAGTLTGRAAAYLSTGSTLTMRNIELNMTALRYTTN